jgi:hypothetical protein
MPSAAPPPNDKFEGGFPRITEMRGLRDYHHELALALRLQKNPGIENRDQLDELNLVRTTPQTHYLKSQQSTVVESHSLTTGTHCSSTVSNS